jgi:hypothetical protein
MTRGQTHTFFVNEFPFYAGLTNTNQKMFLSSFLKLNRMVKLRIPPEIDERERYSMLLGAILTQISFTKVDLPLQHVFKNIILVSSAEFEENQEEMFNQFVIPVRYDTGNFLHQGLYDIVYGFYRCYLLSKNALQHFAAHVGKVEMLMIDRFDFQSRSCLPKCVEAGSDDPLHMLAYFSEQFFNHSLQFRASDPQLYSALAVLWNFNPVNNLMQEKVNKQRNFENPHIASRPKSFLHPVYLFGVVSLFTASLFVSLLTQKTIVYNWVLLLLIVAFSLGGLLFIPIFKKRNIPILKLPFLFFSIFGVGLNTVALLFFINLVTSLSAPEKTIVVPYVPQIVEKSEISDSGFMSYYVQLRIGNSSKKVVPFRASVFREPTFFVLKIQKGIVGFYVVKDKEVLY